MNAFTNNFSTTYAPAPLGNVDLAPVLDLLCPKEAAAARLALSMNCWTEQLLALFANVKVSTVRDWRADRLGPAHIKMGQTVLYPIAEIEMSIKDFAAGHRDAVRPRKR